MQSEHEQKNSLKTRVKEDLLDYIKQQDLSTFTKLPEEEILADILGVNQDTLQVILDEMVSDGILFYKAGEGLSVNKEFFDISVSFNPAMYYVDMIRNSGYKPRSEIVYQNVEPASEEVAEKLHIAVGSPVVTCVKFFYADDRLCVMVEDYASQELVGVIDAELMDACSDSMFYYVYCKTGRKILWDKTEIDIVESKDLAFLHERLMRDGMEDKAYLLLKSVNYDQENRVTLYAKGHIDTSILKYSQIRKKGISYD